MEKKTTCPSALSVGFWDAPVNLAPPVAPKTIQQGPNRIDWNQLPTPPPPYGREGGLTNERPGSGHVI